MTPTDLKILCTALGFTAVVMQESDAELHNRAAGAKAIAQLIEEFCRVNVPNAFIIANDSIGDNSTPAEIDTAIERFKTALLEHEQASLPQDRETLLQFYDRLQLRQNRRQQRHFYDAASDEMIANRVLKMIDDELTHDGDVA